MKKIILTIFCFGMLFPLLGSAARPYGVEEIPNVQVGNRYRFTSNPDGVLSPSAVAEIDSLCYSLRHRALAQVAVVAVEDIRGDDLFSFAHTLFSQWGVGRADSDNGLGILLVVDRREVRFVTGPGLEGVLPDALCKRIQMRYMLPYFREGDYSAGMVAGLRAVASVLEGSELDLGGNDDFRATDDLPAWAVFLIVFLVVFVPLGVMLVGFYRSRRCPRCRAFALVLQSRNLVGQTDHYNLFEDTYRCGKCGFVVKRQSRSARSDNNNHRRGGGMWIGGFGGGHGSGGGFGGGFGGGSFAGFHKRFTRGDAVHASDRGILKTDAEDQSQQVIQNPASEYQAAAYRNRDDPGEPFACQIGQGASGSAVERRENHRSPFRVAVRFGHR